MHISVVEDDEANAQTARMVLEKLGCQVDIAPDGAVAIERFRQREYDLVFMDWQMPVMDGFEATARIRALPRGLVTPIVGTTANRDRKECLAAGMSDPMPKPFLREKVQQVLMKWTYWEDRREAPPQSPGEGAR